MYTYFKSNIHAIFSAKEFKKMLNCDPTYLKSLHGSLSFYLKDPVWINLGTCKRELLLRIIT
jgi:hypothetical protein